MQTSFISTTKPLYISYLLLHSTLPDNIFFHSVNVLNNLLVNKLDELEFRKRVWMSKGAYSKTIFVSQIK